MVDRRLMFALPAAQGSHEVNLLIFAVMSWQCYQAVNDARENIFTRTLATQVRWAASNASTYGIGKALVRR